MGSLMPNEQVKIPCEIYSRTCGYFRPTFTWNKGKQQEFSDREYYNIENFKDKNIKQEDKQ